MPDASSPQPDTSSPPPAAPGPFARFWKRYRKADGAKPGLALVGGFTLFAFLAPFLAHRLPFYWHDFATGATSWPLLREFLAPSDTTEPVLEKGINFLFVFIPVALAACWAMNRWLPGLGKIQSRFISLLFGALFSAAVWFSLGGMIVQAGGDDWLHFEKTPVPDIDDFLDLAALGAPGGPPGNPAARVLVDAELARRGLPPPGTAEADRALRTGIQELVEGPPLAGVDRFAGPAGIDSLGIADANLALGINGPRWNRLLLEAAYPGLLIPMRQFRSSFFAAALAGFLVLIGLTYIFLAGAWQFSLSPRWLVLVGLAVLVALPFRAALRHDHTLYRELAAEGKGRGLFPLIPYGPNEQGFGPRLPPSWCTAAATLGPDDVLSWSRLAAAPSQPPASAARRVADALSRAVPGWADRLDNPEGRGTVVAGLNRLIEEGGFHGPEEPGAFRGDLALAPYLARRAAGGELDPVQQARMNRLLLEKALPRTFAPAAAGRWKKPSHKSGVHVFGTDESGRDVLVRIIHGARVSLSVGFVSVFLATVIGLVMGSLAAYYGGRIDMLISRFIEIMMCFPSFFLILAVIAVLDKRSIINIMLVIGITSWTGVARLIRGEMLRQKKMEYVSASVALGASDTRTIFRHILPNAMAPVLVSISFGITGAILTEASLSFIGFGVTPPTPTWGQLLSETRDSPLANWWLAVFPGLVLFLSVLAYNMVGGALRDALDPRTTLE